jgi:hypothetical protein
MAEPITYEMRGVSPDKPDVHKAIAALDPGLFPGAFCRLVPDHLGGDATMCVGLHADGVGSKSIVAHLMAIETGSARWFRTLAQDSLVMNTDDLLCVGAVGPWIVCTKCGAVVADEGESPRSANCQTVDVGPPGSSGSCVTNVGVGSSPPSPSPTCRTPSAAPRPGARYA